MSANPDPPSQRLRAIVSGMVQGVSFRYYTQIRAQHLGLQGWVRNLPDGTVEVTAEGPARPLQALLDFLQRGPASAYVAGVQAEWTPATGEFSRFDILR